VEQKKPEGQMKYQIGPGIRIPVIVISACDDAQIRE
jgi:hypothetical protein